MAKKISITGNNRGIGLAISKQLEKEGHSIYGLTRSKGFDLQDDWNIVKEKINDATNDCDVFINNAHYDYRQLDVLHYVFSKWKKLDKTIINIGSASGDTNQERFTKWAEYNIQKIALDNACKQLNGLGKCKVVNVRPGWVDTDQTSKLKKPIGLSILKPLKVAQVVSWIINQPFEVHIKDITIEPWYKKSK